MKVPETADANKASTATGTLTALKESGEFTKELKKYTDFFEKLILPEQDIIGVIAVSGENILGCDMFAAHELLAAHYENLINSYATEAITTGKTVTMSQEKVNDYLQTIIEDKGKQEKEIQRKGTMLKDGKRKIHISIF